jgi:RNA 2',3'-cyclic 3'-phosphodiesterase
MRLFVALNLPKEVKDNLFELKGKIPGKLAKINWISKKNLHVTLKFIGEVNEGEKNLIVEKLKNVKFKPLKLSLSKLGFFLFNGKPKVIRFNFKDRKSIAELQQRIDGELLDVTSRDQKFVPHLTLGRIKNIKKEKEFFSKVDEFKFFKDEFIVNSFCLVQSKLTKDGPKYYVVEEFKA